MSLKREMASTATQITSNSTQIDLPIQGILSRDDRHWKHLLGTDSSSSSSILQFTGDDLSVPSMGFLYDYYGITEETQHGPPSPGASPFPSSNEDLKPVSSASSLSTSEKESSGEEVASSLSASNPDSPAVCTCHKTSATTSTAVISSILTHGGEEEEDNQQSVKSERISPASLGISQSNLDVVSGPENLVPKSKFSDAERYVNILEAPTSIIQKQGEDSLTYLNKGQFYAITCEARIPPKNEFQLAKSYIYLVFREEKDPRNEMNHWHYWSSQQPNPNQRAFDIDRKSCQNVEEFLDEFGYNAFAFTWNPCDIAKVVIRINCLSTDFSPQKGVKGIPLHLQVDTHEDMNPESDPVFRTFCQIKVFRDKGAERKNKDESRSAERRLQKLLKNSPNPGVPSISSVFQSPNKVTKFNPVSPKGPKPWIFVPKNERVRSSFSSDDTCVSPHPSSTPPNQTPFLASIRAQESKRQLAAAVNVAKEDFEDLSVLPKQPKCRVVKRKTPAVTVYVRKEEEKVYNALMLENLAIKDLKEAIAQKYGMPDEMIKNVYKKTRKGILVNMDDMMVEQFVDEDDFIIQVNFDNQLGHFELILHY